jgi:hypothetical protein
LPSREAVATHSYRRLGDRRVRREHQGRRVMEREVPSNHNAAGFRESARNLSHCPRAAGSRRRSRPQHLHAAAVVNPGIRSDRTPHECAGGAGPQACGRRPRRPMPTIPIQANANRNPRLEWLRFRGARTRSLLWRLLEQSGQESRDSNPYCPGFLFNQRVLNRPPILKITPPKKLDYNYFRQ